MKKTLAIFSLTACEGCQFQMLNHFEEFEKILAFYEVTNFRLGSDDRVDGPFDVVIVEGAPDGKEQTGLLRELRHQAKTIIIIGSCAHLGGIQSERNELPKGFINRPNIQTASDIIKVDYIIPGCPINSTELFRCLMDVYFGKIFALSDLSVCFECRRHENECLIKNKKPCLGPITRGGCDAICVSAGEACLGCRGVIPTANLSKLREILGTIIPDEEIKDMMTIYGKLKS